MVQTETDDLAKKIIEEISEILIRHRQLDEFDIIPSADAKNRSPVIYVDDKLGLESWCVQHVYMYAYKVFLKLRLRWRKLDSDLLQRLTDILILLNPDISTVWNLRKELLLAGCISPQWELHLTDLVLSKKPKANLPFCQKRYLIHFFYVKHIIYRWVWVQFISKLDDKDRFVRKELETCSLAANRYRNNYHAWSHRQWIFHENFAINLFDTELQHVRFFIERHVSDHCSLHYLQYLLIYMTPYLKDVAILYSQELESNQMMLSRYAEHEALWYHRRFLIVQFKKICSESIIKNNVSQLQKRQKFGIGTPEQIVLYELSKIEDILDGNPTPYERNVLKYQHWLKNSLPRISTVT